MILGIPKEIKPQEYRVALTPEPVARLTRLGHRVLVQKGAGAGCGFPDQAYRDNGAVIVSDARAVWKEAELILKVKEPLPKEYVFFRQGLLLFTYLHLAGVPGLARALVKKGVTAIGYETVRGEGGGLPLLQPMSEIAGKLSVLLGAEYLRTDRGEKGVLISRVEGTTAGRVTIVGAGNVGTAALSVALGVGARVTLLDRDAARLEAARRKFSVPFETRLSEGKAMEEILSQTDLLVGAVNLPGAKAPRVVTRAMVSRMQKGSVIVDVSIDQGGCVETIRPTTHARPVYLYKGVIHYGVTNMPSLVSRSATEALVFKTYPYVEKLAGEGLNALEREVGFQQGLQVFEGKIVHEEVRKALG